MEQSHSTSTLNPYCSPLTHELMCHSHIIQPFRNSKPTNENVMFTLPPCNEKLLFLVGYLGNKTNDGAKDIPF